MESKISVLEEFPSIIAGNSALIGGGIRYFSSDESTSISKEIQRIIKDNTAILYGNNFAMLPKKLQVNEDSLEQLHTAASSSEQIKYLVRFLKK